MAKNHVASRGGGVKTEVDTTHPRARNGLRREHTVETTMATAKALHGEVSGSTSTKPDRTTANKINRFEAGAATTAPSTKKVDAAAKASQVQEDELMKQVHRICDTMGKAYADMDGPTQATIRGLAAPTVAPAVASPTPDDSSASGGLATDEGDHDAAVLQQFKDMVEAVRSHREATVSAYDLVLRCSVDQVLQATGLVMEALLAPDIIDHHLIREKLVMLGEQGKGNPGSTSVR